jgi:hypothetical protein
MSTRGILSRSRRYRDNSIYWIGSFSYVVGHDDDRLALADS